jgi:hypothetical protein
MRRKLALLPAMLLAIALTLQATAIGDEGRDVVEFDTMAGVVEPFTGSAHPVRGLSGGGLPWELDRARGRLRPDGRLEIRVEGLVLARRAPVPANLQGTNPVAAFRGAVSCLTPAAPDQGETVLTDPVPATPDGDATIEATVDLPEPCIAPVVFVTSPTNAWFAATGR